MKRPEKGRLTDRVFLLPLPPWRLRRKEKMELVPMVVCLSGKVCGEKGERNVVEGSDGLVSKFGLLCWWFLALQFRNEERVDGDVEDVKK